ncbi:MAG: hypothetical protein FJ014_02275 [Chloroflexi bacterium]|nr:hypothetical protein [Chloroflexota bacterium]
METTATITIQEFDRGVLAFLKFLERAPQQVDQARLGRAKREVEELRALALEAEIKADYPNAKLSRRLLSLIGTEPELPLEEEQQAIIEAVTWREQ